MSDVEVLPCPTTEEHATAWRRITASRDALGEAPYRPGWREAHRSRCELCGLTVWVYRTGVPYLLKGWTVCCWPCARAVWVEAYGFCPPGGPNGPGEGSA